MSDVPQMGEGFPGPFGFDLNKIMRMLQSPGPVNMEVARETAESMAKIDVETGEPRVEVPIDPDTARAFDDVVRAVQLMVSEATGISGALTVPARTVDRSTWSSVTLTGLEPVLAALAAALVRSDSDAPDLSNPAAAAAFSPDMLFAMMMPLLLGGWAGSMIGLLSHRALGQFDLPLPLDGPPAMLFIAPNVDAFAEEWALPLDELRYALALREVVHGAQRSVPWVRARLLRCASAYVGAYEVQPDAMENQLGGLDPSDPSSMEALASLSDPDTLLGAMRTERQGPLLEELQRFVSVLEGYTDVVVESIGEKMVSAHGRLDEALRRHRLERGDATGFVDRLLGLELDRGHYETGVAFCRGVLERSDGKFDQLNRLWSDEAMVPTAAELVAPGLWLARIDLPRTAVKIGVLGAGVMGGGIAQVCALAGDDVVCYDIAPAALDDARAHMTTGRFGLDGAVARAKVTRAEADSALQRVTFTQSFDEAAATDLVIEAVPERLDVKIRVFRDLDRLAAPATILASNTSGLPITALAAATDRPDRVIGWHWASPAPVMKLAEIVVTPETSEATIATVVAAATRCGKHPIVVKDNPMQWGFVANRVYFAMVREAQRVVDEGIATRAEVDQLMMDCFRWPSGPFGMVAGAGSGWS